MEQGAGVGRRQKAVLGGRRAASTQPSGRGWERGLGVAPGRPAVRSPSAPALGLRPQESQALGQPAKAWRCWQGSAGVSVDTLRHF